jgi:hypothetical protein
MELLLLIMKEVQCAPLDVEMGLYPELMKPLNMNVMMGITEAIK